MKDDPTCPFCFGTGIQKAYRDLHQSSGMVPCHFVPRYNQREVPSVVERTPAMTNDVRPIARPRAEWTADDGIVQWWMKAKGSKEFFSAPYLGRATDADRSTEIRGYHNARVIVEGCGPEYTHWTPIVVPRVP